MRRVALALAIAAGLVLASASSAGAATFTVDTPVDEVAVAPVDGAACDSLAGPGTRCSLRAAIQEANATALTDTVVVLGADYDLTLSGADDTAVSGDLDVTRGVTIQGQGRPVIDAQLGDRVLHIGPGPPPSPVVTVSGVELRNGGSVARGAGIYVEDGALTLDRSTVAGGTASSALGDADGGGVWLATGSHTITASTISGNTAGGQDATGGGLGVASGAAVTLVNSTLSGNSAEADPGAALGGGIWSAGAVALSHVTVHENAAAGVFASVGGNLFASAGSVALRATILSAGSAASGTENCQLAAAPANQGSNLEAPVTGSSQCGLSAIFGDRLASDAGLTPLADRGGPTLTHALFSHSPALDAIPSCFPVVTDQRGEPRPGGVACEIGSFERQEPVPAGATCFGKKPTIVGRKGVERIVGTPIADVILGSAGSELIKARGGKDLVCAGKGKDRVKGGPSRDRIAGEEGKDRLFGHDGKDELRGDHGVDFLDGGPGRDRLSGGPGRDTCRKSPEDKLRSC